MKSLGKHVLLFVVIFALAVSVAPLEAFADESEPEPLAMGSCYAANEGTEPGTYIPLGEASSGGGMVPMGTTIADYDYHITDADGTEWGYRGPYWNKSNGTTKYWYEKIKLRWDNKKWSFVELTSGAERAKGVYDIPGVKRVGIDVSHYQGTINWSKVKGDGITFAIVSCGDGRYGNSTMAGFKDPKFATNIQEARAAGIQVGAYIFARSTTEARAKLEAQQCLSMLKEAGMTPGKLSYPAYFDMEHSNQASLSSAQRLKVAKAFCNTISDAGYIPGIYASQSWWNSYLTDAWYKTLPMWVARYSYGSKESGISGTGIWQFSSKGTVSGISGYADMDFDYHGPFSNTGFKDVSASHWVHTGGYLDYVNSKGIMTGYADGTFRPDAKITRGEMACALYKAAGSPSVSFNGVFSDVSPNAYYAKAVSWCYSKGVVTGYDDTGLFKPNGNITRAEFAAMLFRYAKLSKSVSGTASDYAAAPDASAVPSWASQAMGWAFKSGVLTGYATTGRLNPGWNATRSQAAKMMCVTMRDVLGNA